MCVTARMHILENRVSILLRMHAVVNMVFGVGAENSYFLRCNDLERQSSSGKLAWLASLVGAIGT